MSHFSSILLVALVVPFCLCQVPITLDDVIGQGTSFGQQGFSGTWSRSGKESVFEFTQNRNFMTLDIETNTTSLLFNATIIEELLPDDTTSFSLSFSSDKNFILIARNARKLWRHSSFARYYVYDVNSVQQTIRPINPPGQTDQELQLVVWASTGNALAFVHQNDVYYMSSAISATVHQITTSGSTSDGLISNGHTDWVYEEEMFGSGRTLWFSPDSRYFAFVSFDDNGVDRFQYQIYGEAGTYFENLENSYPDLIDIPYPRVGRKNPEWKLSIVDTTAATPTPIEVSYTDLDVNNRYYIATMVWSGADRLILVTLDRFQTKARYHVCTAAGSCAMRYPYDENAGWIDVYNRRPHSTLPQFLTLHSMPIITDSDEKYRHIILVNTDTGLATQITRGRLSVISIIGWNEAEQTIYFTGTGLSPQPDPSESHVYSIKDDGSDMVSTCLTCNLQNTHGEGCRANSASFSSAFTFMLHTCSGPNPLEVAFRHTTDSADLLLVRVDNQDLRDKLAAVLYPTRNDTIITLGQGANTYTTRARLLLPANFNPNKKYPLFISVYGGPGSQNIGQGFEGVHWGVSLVSDRQVIYGLELNLQKLIRYIDGRGSARQSSNYLYELYERLGTVEIIDQIETTKKLLEMYSFLDANSTAIWGWSYGGFATAHVLAQDTDDVFKCGISVATVTIYFFYDTIYTERYMKTPQVNLDNYIHTDLTVQAEKFKNKTFFLVHGNADDNVHYQQSMILSRALEQKDVLFHQLSYPDEDHSIASQGMRRHLYHTFEDFLFKECFPSIPTAPTEPPKDNGSSMIVSSSVLFFSAVMLFAFILQ